MKFRQQSAQQAASPIELDPGLLEKDRRSFLTSAALSLAGLIAATAFAADGGPYTFDLPEQVGDYQGQRILANGDSKTIFGQVIAEEEGKFRVRLAPAIEKRARAYVTLSGDTRSDAILFQPGIDLGEQGLEVLQVAGQGLLIRASRWDGSIKEGKLEGFFAGSENGRYSLKPMGMGRYESSTMGAKPPEEATVLFNGSLENFQSRDGGKAEWKIVEGKAMQIVPDTSSLLSKREFGDHHLHIEFRSSFMPAARGQARANSGVYLQGRYEVQILDSYGLEGEWNECGGIYGVAKPIVNMCAPPTIWQTYDIDFTAPRFDSQGKKTANARITVRHNGVLIHDDVELPSFTGSSLAKNEVAQAPLMLQNHGGDAVQFRNIWAVAKNDK